MIALACDCARRRPDRRSPIADRRSLVEPRAAGSRRWKRFAISRLRVSVGGREPSVIDLDDCPSENEIVGFLEGALSDPERARIEAHCANCERCREGVAQAAYDSAAAVARPRDGAARPLDRELASVVQEVLGGSSSAEAAVGTWIGRFELVGVLGRGQFGVVYRARDTQLGRMVAVKVMRRAGRQDRPIRETLFQTEAAAAARLQHPNIVTLHDYGEFEGAPYLILELLEGDTLRTRLAGAGRLAPLDALAIASDVARALVEAHAAGVIHRDIKPGNVFLCASGQTKVLDFGLAQLQSEVDRGSEPAGSAAARAGTPRYMAPELLRGQAADACTDVYAVGLTLFEMLVGLLPSGGGPSIAERIAGAPLLPRLRRLLGKATAFERAGRFQHAGELLSALIRARSQLARRRHAGRRLGIPLAGVLLAATAAVAYRGLASSQRAGKPTVAVLGFDDLSGRPDTAWLSTALSEMLDADLAASPAMHVVPPELVSHARVELGMKERDPVEPRTLQDLRRYLGADFVVIGSYLSVAADAGTQTRLDVRIEDTRTQRRESFSETGRDNELLDLVARIASRMRVRLAGTAIAAEEARTLRASMPAATEAVRLYAEGLRRWRSADLLEARDVLARAVAAEPDFPLAHSAFSQVLHALGEEARMRDEAQRAFELSSGLRRQERWLVEARYREAIGQWPQARELRRTLHELFPDDLEYGLELADALNCHRQNDEARAVIAELRRLPPPQRDDPRIDLYDASAQTGYRVREALAISAADKAKALGVRWILGKARLQEADAERHLGELERSLVAAEEARDIYQSIGDREGLSIALYEVASTRGMLGEAFSVELAGYEEALELERQIGNNDQVTNMLGNIAFESLLAGYPAQAAARIDEIERLGTGTAPDQTERLRALQWLEQGDLAGAFAQLEHVRRAFFEAGKSRGYELKLLGDVLMARGELDQARARVEQYLAQGWSAESGFHVVGVLALSRFDLEAGQTQRAEARVREMIALCEAKHNISDLVTAQVLLARISIAEHRFEEAKAAAEAALALAARTEAMPGWIDAQIALARAVLGLHPRDIDTALAAAQTALDRALERGLLGHAYEARLAAGEIAAQGHRPDARAQLRALADEADQHGFGLIARKARAAAAAPQLTER
ncbi:MAG TPA: protein kinase [Kofleriaceae bacterium]